MYSRLAPTPSGLLHRGNGLSFVLTWLLVQSKNGKLHLRIDDLDAARCRPEYLDDIFTTLRWLELDYDSGPRHSLDFTEHHSQHLRLPRYANALANLREQDLLFACNCSRTAIQAHSPDGQYPGTCRHRNLSLDAPGVAWRLRTPENENAEVKWQDLDGREHQFKLGESMRDVVVRKKDGLPAYQLASVVDDIELGITLIVRGEDLLPSTAVQRYLAQLLAATEANYSRFNDLYFWHHPLVRDEHGQKMAKSAGAASLKALREAEAEPLGFYSWLGDQLGLSTTHSLSDVVRELGLERERSLPS